MAAAHGWRLAGVHYYIGVPGPGRLVRGESLDQWETRVGRWRDQGVSVFTSTLTGHNREKGVDLRMALDMVRRVEDGGCDVIVVVSCDQDFREAVVELRNRAAVKGRALQVATAFPSDGTGVARGIDNADRHIPLSRQDFAHALDVTGRTVLPLTRPQPYQRTASWLRRSAAAAGALYMAFTAATFGHIHASRAAVAPAPAAQVLTDCARSLAWPVYWSSEERRVAIAKTE